MNGRQYACALFLAALLLPGMATAQKLYKYRDASGATVYSQSKPPEVAAEEVRLLGVKPANTQAKDDLDKTTKALDERREARADAATKTPQEQEREAIIKRNCEVARANLKVLESGTRVVANDKDGKPYYLDEQQSGAKKAEAQKQVDEYCK